MNSVVLKLLVNSAWQIPLCGVLGWCAARLLRRWPAAWSVICWRASLGLAALLPIVTAFWSPARSTSGIRIPAGVAAAVASGALRESNTGATAWLAIAYSAAVAFFAVRLLWQWWSLRGLNEDTVSIPVAFGWWRPRLILPRRFADSATPLAKQAAIAHETTHIRHHDYAFNLAIEIIALPVAFHPLLTWMKRRAAGAVEMRCDEVAAGEIGDARQYALGLIEAARVLGSSPSPRLTAAFFDPHTFEERIMNLTLVKFQPHGPARVAAAVILAGSVLLAAGLSTSYAAQTQDSKVYKVGEDGVKAPKVLHRIDPTYPEHARDANITGSVLLAVEISTSGRAENVRVERSLEESLDQSAVEAVQQWAFQPGTKDGQPVRVAARIEVNFKLK